MSTKINNVDIDLRDFFAAHAINAIIIGNDAQECAMTIGAAKDAYQVADAMLAVREQLDESKK